ncbi:MAG: HlyD family efflux transporter periplasmic adaptor subunit [bacterium]|nr:HlyD family efflux transporter periplasmic adaptor subunit [bacterium]
MAKRSPKTLVARRLMWGIAALIVLTLIVLALLPSPVPVDVALVARGPLQVTLDEEGETRVRDRYVISSPVSGRVLRIEIEPGEPVVAGETALVRFQPAPPSLLDARTLAETRARVEAAQADVGAARAQRERARAELEYAESEWARVGRLAESGIVSEEETDAARLAAGTAKEALSAAEFAVATAEHRLEQARVLLRRHDDDSGADSVPITIRSPVGGVVLRRLRESAAVVPAGEPLIEVADPTRMEIVADFLSEDAVRIDVGSEVLIERWGGERTLRGRVRRVEPAGFTKVSALGVEEQRVNVIVDFEDSREAWEALGDGFRVETRVIVAQRDDAVQVPTSALFRHEGAWAVFRVGDDVVERVLLEIGIRNGMMAEVVDGLGEGDVVVVHPSDAVQDGVKVERR